MTGSATKSQRAPGKVLRLFFAITSLVCWAPFSNQCVEYGTIPAFFGQFPHHFPVLVCLRASRDWGDVSYHKERDLRALLWLFLFALTNMTTCFCSLKHLGIWKVATLGRLGFLYFKGNLWSFWVFISIFWKSQHPQLCCT